MNARDFTDDVNALADWKDASFDNGSGDFVMNRVLGEGVHSCVYSAWVRGVSVAVKVYHSEDDFVRERSFLRQFLGHPYLPQMLHQGYVFSLCVHKPALVMPLCVTVSASRVMRDGRDWVVACRHLKSALASLRRLGITHNDIKPDNVMVNVDSGHIMLNDFSCACSVGEETLYADHKFVKPDCRNRRCPSSYEADVYSAARVAREWAVAVVKTPVNLPLDMTGLQRWFSADIAQ
jgi:serine/threonine protein kinase